MKTKKKQTRNNDKSHRGRLTDTRPVVLDPGPGELWLYVLWIL